MVHGTFHNVKRMSNFSKEFNLTHPLTPIIPFPSEDVCGMGTEILMIWHTQDLRIYGEYIQYKTTRKFEKVFQIFGILLYIFLRTTIIAEDLKKLVPSNFQT